MVLHPHTAAQRKRIQANRKTALTARKKSPPLSEIAKRFIPGQPGRNPPSHATIKKLSQPAKPGTKPGPSPRRKNSKRGQRKS